MKMLETLEQLTPSFLPPLRAWNGKKTAELVRRPGGFGLGQVPKDLKPDATTTGVCGFCSTGCALNIHIKDGEAINLTPTTNYPVNMGMACPKGWEALAVLDSEDRATTPLIRDRDTGAVRETDWSEAMSEFTTRFKKVQEEHGKESVAFISTGQIVTEEMAFLGSLAKFGMGIKHGDGNTRQCMATSVVAYKQSFGFDAPPYTYQDFEESDTIILAGSNLCIAHPIMWQRVERNKNNPNIIVVDPRKTETAVAGTHHYGITPKSDLVFFYGIAHLLIKNNWLDHDFINASVEGFDDFAKHVEDFTPKRVAKESGISEERLLELAELIHAGKKVSFWWTMGVNQGHEATRTAQAIMNLALMTGNIGKPGTGANSITGQCNAMGSRLFSNTTNLLGGHDFANQEHRDKISNILGIEDECIPNEVSLPYHKIIQGIEDGTIKGLWVIATNGAHSWINQNHFTKLMGKLDFLVVQDMYSNTETAEHADLVLPAAGWAEKDGTFINSERRIGLVKKVKRSPGVALSDFNIFRLIAQSWGCGEMFKEWTSPEKVFGLLQELSEGQPCDITGIEDYQHIDDLGGVQWPAPKSAFEGRNIERQRRLFVDGKFYTPNHKAKLLFADPIPLAEPTSEQYPMILLTGRGTSAQWHTQSRTAKSEVLKKLYPKDVYLEIHADDAAALGVSANDLVTISSSRGSMQASAYISPTVQPGQVFLPMHYAKINQLTHPSFDSYSHQPNYKFCAVSVAKA